MRSEIRKILFLLLICSTSIICFIYGRSISFSEQWPIYKGLRATSGIIFGVIGAWLAIVYPRALKQVFGSSNDEPVGTIEDVERLLVPLRYATLILLMVLAVGLIAPILKQINYALHHKSILRGFSLVLVGVATLVQMWSVVATVMHTERSAHTLREEKKKKEKLEALRANQPDS